MSNLYFAPVQGHTDAAYRHYHAMVYGANQLYFTPFIRLEKETIRPRDLKDLHSELNANYELVPQIIFRNAHELNVLIEILKNQGIRNIDLNMGCPFPLQTGHGRGAATIQNEELAQEVVKCIKNNEEISFSIKLRLGLNNPDEWKHLIPYLNEVELKHIALHPRVAKQQYGGDIDYEMFRDFLNESKNPVIYNGDIKTPEDIKDKFNKYDIKGVMVGRGILGRPSLFAEASEDREWDKDTRLNKMLEFHRLLFSHYSNVLCGESQIISKIQPFWEYAEEEIGRKAWKAIKKAGNLAKYQTAVASI